MVAETDKAYELAAQRGGKALCEKQSEAYMKKPLSLTCILISIIVNERDSPVKINY